MVQYQKFPPAIITPSPALFTPFLVNSLPIKLAATVPNSIGRNPSFFPFVSF